MYVCGFSLIILLALNISRVASKCDSSPHTFSQTFVEICDDTSCTNRTIDVCFGEDEIVIITVLSPVTALRKGAFNNATDLLQINLRGIKLETIQPKAFFNLTNLNEIDASRNHLRAIQDGVFSKLSMTTLNLANNQISEVGSYAFAEMRHLSTLKLNGNFLDRVESSWFLGTENIEVLLLAENLLTALDMDVFSQFARLRYLFLNSNQIHSIYNTLAPNLRIVKLQLSGNNLTDVGFLSKDNVKFLYLGLNKISVGNKLAKYVASSKIKMVYLSPNPWLCICLLKIEDAMRKHKVESGFLTDDHVISPSDYDAPICVHLKYTPIVCDAASAEDVEESRRVYFNGYKFAGPRRT